MKILIRQTQEEVMSFWNKVKQFFGIGGVKLELQVNPAYSKKEGLIQGKVNVTTKSPQTIKEIKLKLEEVWQTGRGEQKTSKTFELGTSSIPGFSIQPGESKLIDFTLPFHTLKSEADRLKEKGGFVGSLGKLEAFTNAEKSSYSLIASAETQGTAFSPNDVKSIQLTD